MAHIPISTEELGALFDGSNTVIMPDGKLGVLARFRVEKPECGVQVLGEDDLQWIGAESFQHDGGGAFTVFRPNDPLTVSLFSPKSPE